MLYRLLQELLDNACKRADIGDVSITLYQREHCLSLDATDNGVGILSEKIPGFGIQRMREWVSALGDELTLESNSGMRTAVNLPTNL